MIRVIAKKKEPLSLLETLSTLSKVRAYLLSSDLAREICIEHNKDISLLMGIPIDLSSEIDVSAKTEDGRIILNAALLDGEFEILMRYVIHELVHVMQHIDGGSKDKKKDYLNRDSELDAFKYQIEFDSENRSEKDVMEYVEGLLDFHDIPEDERDDKEEELMEQVD